MKNKIQFDADFFECIFVVIICFAILRIVVPNIIDAFSKVNP